MNDRKPQPGRRVRVTYEAVVDTVEDDGRVYVHSDDKSEVAYVLASATVEVLETADDPSKDPIWTVRTVEPTPEAADGNTVVKFGDSFWLFPSKLGNGYGRLDWSRVKDSKVIGAVPGTPAAERTVSAEQIAEWQEDDALPDWERELIHKEYLERQAGDSSV